MKNILLLFIVMALVACSAGNQTETERNQEKWRDANISHYRFHLNVGCFCAFSEDMPLIIEVMDGKVISMEYQSGKEIDATNREFFDKFATIDRIFSELNADLAGAADEVTVTYDSTHGFPVDVSINYVIEAADDEVYLNLSNFEVLS